MSVSRERINMLNFLPDGQGYEDVTVGRPVLRGGTTSTHTAIGTGPRTGGGNFENGVWIA